VFLGSQPLRLDDKGRLFLPAKWRDDLAAGLVMNKGQEHCVYLFATAEFERMGKQMSTAPVTSKGLRDSARVFFSSATAEVPDRQGRVTVPPSLRAYAGLTRDCVAVGANTRAEIWDAQAWQDYLLTAEPAFAELSEEVLPGVF
jgi:MraZ protein